MISQIDIGLIKQGSGKKVVFINTADNIFVKKQEQQNIKVQ